MKKIPPEAFDFYFSLAPGRSYQAVAENYGVTKKAVTNLAKREGWQQRLADIEAKAREEADQQKADESKRAGAPHEGPPAGTREGRRGAPEAFLRDAR